MGWEGNRWRLPHGADDTNLYSGDGIPDDILTVGAIQKGQLTAGTFYKDMTALFLQGGTCVSEHSTTKAVNTFVEIGTTGIKIVVPERTATEKNKTQRQQQILSRTYPKAGNRGPYNGGHRQK
ncbi:MAG: hypothetical protein KH897_15905 [Bacteroides sp.]|uniref:hypothetical protein n=1 Tax=Bacteroides sp. TaxID=29523 RepID=UPI0025BE5551|nr:hypothetical protein [Bacteroides sp.]MBS6239808.1 hypothetical protein [Bacteroides sp.]